MTADPDEGIDPEARYRLFGQFDRDSFDEDLRNYRRFFDGNGWPLFGEYDPYALLHPITGLPWYLSPREPNESEADSSYADWYALATDFESIRVRIGFLVRSRPPPLPDETASDGKDAPRYLPTAKRAVEGNLRYLKRRIVPELEAMFADQQSGPLFALLWGEFCGIAEGLFESVPVAMQRHQNREIGRAKHKDAQLKWYLHWLRRAKGSGVSSRQATKQLLTLILSIVDERIQTPAGFEKSWFSAMLYKPRTQASGAVMRNARTGGFSERFVRSRGDPKRLELLKSLPDELPAIPLRLEDFSRER